MAIAAQEPKKAPSLKYQRDRDREMVKGIFKNYETPGGYLGFCTKFYLEDPVEKWEMLDGQMYTIPRCVARHLNNNAWVPVYDHVADPDGVRVQKIVNKVKRFGFNSLDFMDLDDEPSKIALPAV